MNANERRAQECEKAAERDMEANKTTPSKQEEAARTTTNSLADEKTDLAHGREPLWILKDIAVTLEANNIESVRNIIVDTAVFDQQRSHPSWPAKDLNRWFACETSGLNFNDNCIMASVRNRSGRITLTLEPDTAFIRYTSKIKATSSKNDAFGAYRTSEPNKLVFFTHP